MPSKKIGGNSDIVDVVVYVPSSRFGLGTHLLTVRIFSVMGLTGAGKSTVGSLFLVIFHRLNPDGSSSTLLLGKLSPPLVMI
jgi:hypothetical protein